MMPNSCWRHAPWLVALASFTTAGCLCPPCPAKGVAAGPGAAAEGSSASVAAGTRTVIWDGDEVGTGAQSWDSCDQKPKCKVKVSVEPGVGIDGSNGIKLHGDGSGYIGMGWNIYGWYPENAGFDLEPYSHLTFQIRVEGKTPGAPVDPGAPGVLLGCSANKVDSTTVPIEKYMKGYNDGKWHKVSIPIPALVKGKSAKFDLRSFWEFRLSTWSGSERNFDIYIDDIAAEKK
jgi:hypothetical protein